MCCADICALSEGDANSSIIIYVYITYIDILYTNINYAYKPVLVRHVLAACFCRLQQASAGVRQAAAPPAPQVAPPQRPRQPLPELRRASCLALRQPSAASSAVSGLVSRRPSAASSAVSGLVSRQRPRQPSAVSGRSSSHLPLKPREDDAVLDEVDEITPPRGIHALDVPTVPGSIVLNAQQLLPVALQPTLLQMVCLRLARRSEFYSVFVKHCIIVALHKLQYWTSPWQSGQKQNNIYHEFYWLDT